MNKVGERLREYDDRHAIRNCEPISADEFFDNMREMLGLEQEAQGQNLDGEVLAAIIGNLGYITELQNALTELCIETAERANRLENNYKAMVKAFNGIGKIWD
jgi:dsDNA-specific endonuclease/ATPase MutS2